MNHSSKKTGLRPLLSVAIVFLLVIASSVLAGSLNEWTFEPDENDLPLSDTINSGAASPLAQFSPNFELGSVFTASATNISSSASNRVLLCIGENTTTNGAWISGETLNAGAVPDPSLNYLRYDVAYDFSSTNNDSSTVLGAYFTGEAGDKVAGLVLTHDSGNLQSTAPANRTLTTITNDLPFSGKLIAIAEVSTDQEPATLKVWYGLSDSTPTNYGAPAFITNIVLSSITNLRFQATGDFRPAGSTNYAAVDNVRHASTWADITAPIPHFSEGPKVEIVSVTVTNPSGTVGTDIGETNTVEVVIRSLGAPASNLISSLNAATNSEYFTIISNDTSSVVLTYPQYVTNTFFLTANTNAAGATYTFNVNVTADHGVYTNTTFTLVVGSLISYQSNSIAWVSGGIFPNEYEPGEVINITVFSTNNGAKDVSNVSNSLSANPAYFTISNLTSSIYPSMPRGAEASTTYRVTILAAATNGTHWFSVTNRSGTSGWPAKFSIDVFNKSVPSVYPPSIIMNLPTGRVTNNTEVVVTNTGNVACTFSVTDDSVWGVSSYDMTTNNLGKTAFLAQYNNVIVLKDPDTKSVPISSTNAGISSAINIGFNFPFYGTTYSNFYVTADGYIGLSNITNVPARSVDRSKPLPATDTNVAKQIIAPFWGILNSPAGSIRYDSSSECLAISFSGVSKEREVFPLSFQVALFTNGCIEFRYATITGITNNYGQTDVTIGIQGSATSYTNLTLLRPGNGTSILLSPQKDQWISYTPSQNVTVAPQSSQRITFRADASGKPAGTNTTFKAWFNWSTGGSNDVVVSVDVTNAAPVYSAVSSLAFTGLAGQVTNALFVITNAGTSTLTFAISNQASDVAGYITTNPPYSWIDISSTGTKVSLLTPAPVSPYITSADEGFSAMIPIKFAFPFYGGSYSQFCVSVNGALRLDTTGRVVSLVNLAYNSSSMPAQMVAPYWGDLVMDANATLNYDSTTNQLVITWENVRQYGMGGGSNQSFQAILKPSGNITFQYKNLEGAISWPNTTIGLRDTFSRTVRADIRQPGDRIVSTNQYGMVSTQYVSVVSNRAVQFQFAQVQVIRYTPVRGDIQAGSNAVITIAGDASNQSDGTNSISTNATLTITHNVPGTNTLAVTFTVTNSAEAVFVRSVASALADGSIDSDGDGISDDLERIAGTDPQNADSVFTPTIGRDSSGTLLSWPAPLDGVQRNYTLYFTTNLMSLWEFLYTVTNGTTYLDTVHSNVPAIYYKITVPIQ
jgi:hypothetical protein